jgi:hypothetical protein
MLQIFTDIYADVVCQILHQFSCHWQLNAPGAPFAILGGGEEQYASPLDSLARLLRDPLLLECSFVKL